MHLNVLCYKIVLRDCAIFVCIFFCLSWVYVYEFFSLDSASYIVIILMQMFCRYYFCTCTLIFTFHSFQIYLLILSMYY